MHIPGALLQRAIAAAILVLPATSILAAEVLVKTPSGNSLTMEINPEDSFCVVMNRIETSVSELEGPLSHNANSTYLIDYTTPAIVHCSTYRAAASPRQYAAPVTSEEKKDMRYLLKNMATNSWTQLLSNSSAMNKAGDRIDHVHPLRFLQTIFADEELKGCLHAIRDRSIVWKKFFSGLSDTLQEEANRNNVLPYATDFATSLNINPGPIQKLIQEQKWSKLVDQLLKDLPRTGDPGRYDM